MINDVQKIKPRVPAKKLKIFIEFVDFLKSKDAMSYFDEVTIEEVFFNCSPSGWITGAFNWPGSQKGDFFWWGIDKLWRTKLKIGTSTTHYVKFMSSGENNAG